MLACMVLVGQDIKIPALGLAGVLDQVLLNEPAADHPLVLSGQEATQPT
jgi:hypothetical protein